MFFHSAATDACAESVPRELGCSWLSKRVRFGLRSGNSARESSRMRCVAAASLLTKRSIVAFTNARRTIALQMRPHKRSTTSRQTRLLLSSTACDCGPWRRSVICLICCHRPRLRFCAFRGVHCPTAPLAPAPTERAEALGPSPIPAGLCLQPLPTP